MFTSTSLGSGKPCLCFYLLSRVLIAPQGHGLERRRHYPSDAPLRQRDNHDFALPSRSRPRREAHPVRPGSLRRTSARASHSLCLCLCCSFAPHPWMPPEANASTSQAGLQPTVKEVWFAGTSCFFSDLCARAEFCPFFTGAHSNVGGGQTVTDGDVLPRLSHLSLRWMIRESLEQGLALELSALRQSPIFSPFVEEAKRRLETKDEALLRYASVKFFGNDVDPALVALIFVASLPSARSRDEAIASRGDSLSLSISKNREPGCKGWATRVIERMWMTKRAASWWIHEMTPTLRGCSTASLLSFLADLCLLLPDRLGRRRSRALEEHRVSLARPLAFRRRCYLNTRLPPSLAGAIADAVALSLPRQPSTTPSATASKPRRRTSPTAKVRATASKRSSSPTTRSTMSNTMTEDGCEGRGERSEGEGEWGRLSLSACCLYLGAATLRLYNQPP
jgi:hypothetical protein